ESSGTYGAPRVYAVLRRRGRRIGRSRIKRLMRQAGLRGLAALPRGTRTTDSRHAYPIAPNPLGRNFVADRPGRVWLADLTYIPPAKAGFPSPPYWICIPARLSAGPRAIRHYSVDEPQTRLSGQRTNGELLSQPEDRTGSPSDLWQPRRGSQRPLPIYRGLL